MNNAQDPLEKPPQPHNVLLKKKKKVRRKMLLNKRNPNAY